MFISSTNIRQLIDAPTPLISPCDRTFIEGSFYDLRLGEIFMPPYSSYSSFIGQNARHLPEIIPLKSTSSFHVSSRLKAENDVYRLFPGFYLAQTIETITPPRWLMAILNERTTMFRSGAITRVTKVPHGYSGIITAGIHIPEGCSLSLEKGGRFLSVCFAVVVTLKLGEDFEPVLPFELNFDGGDAYAGIWGGSKATTDGVERAF